MTSPSIWAVVPSAGLGRRFGSKNAKQYVELGGEAIAQRTLTTLIDTQLFTKIIVPLSSNDQLFAALPVSKRAELESVIGGDTRAQSVLKGLRALSGRADANDWVMVHDMARPLITKSDVMTLLSSLKDHPVGGILALPATDTVKFSCEVNTTCNASVVERTIDREAVWLAQTPQLFRYGLLCDALDLAIEQGLPVTDEASAMEFQQHEVALVMGNPKNIKITHRGDLQLAEFYLAVKEESQSKSSNESGEI